MSSQEGFAEYSQPGKEPKIESIWDFSAESLGQIRLWLEMNPPAVPIQNILGFTQFAATMERVATAEQTSSASYTDLATVGPELAGLADGNYVVVWGCSLSIGTAGAFCGVRVNATDPVDADAITSGATDTTSGMSATLVALSAGNNSLKLRYRSGGGAATFARRFLLVFKYSNL